MPDWATSSVPIYLTNVGKVDLPPFWLPDLDGHHGSGRAHPLKPGHGTYFGDMTAVDLRPGARGNYLLAGTDMCLGATTTTTQPVVPSGRRRTS